MKKIYYITAVFATLFLVGCGDGIDLPGVNVETDLNKIPLPDNNVNLEQVELKPSTEPMLHEGLHTEEDFQRIRDKKAAGEEPCGKCLSIISRKPVFAEDGRYLSYRMD